MAGSQAIRASVAASDYDHALPGRQNLRIGLEGVAQVAAVLLGQVFHREMDSFQFASRDV